ncbi:biosynthetic arginine decarboxylase [Roseimaritima sediminicola]|uniref:biosynthetic arginine decarboxylase n=1 Tax=Roseimaritima sediminicola TaxID=2662066 RepID=UPI00129846D3|nr:biosynthetic arginine decarboxylase [Roseimaritima sediminicola]
MSLASASRNWTVAESAELYDVQRWGNGYFSIDPAGNLLVHPSRDPQQSVCLKEICDRLQQRGYELPVLLRFNGILRDRLREMHDCFATAMQANDYQSHYRCIFPIKVNQQREVIEKLVEFGTELGAGLEAGSKPELMAVAAHCHPSMPIVCNGFKDDEFIHLAMICQKLGRTVIPVVEKFSELERILVHAQQLDVRPNIGIRVKLAARGQGRWQSSGGYRSKFGLTVSEVMRAVNLLESRGMLDCCKLLHFHLGSQITNIRPIKAAINEAVRVYCELHRRGAGLEYLDVGGGLGVDYDGSQTNYESSMNYTTQEYANDVVYQIKVVCDEAQVPHPIIFSESGRAVAAHHSVLVFGVLGVTTQGEQNEIPATLPDDYEQPVVDLHNTYREVNARNVVESFHDCQASLDMAMNLFASGYLSLEQRVVAENVFFATCQRIRKCVQDMDYVPEELENLDRMLSDNYFCNFSLFQSVPDSWAIKQLFPIMPIHRLDEAPTRHAVLGDITCDSDGKIDRFTDRRSVKNTLPLHPFDGSPYMLGAFLVGAYQEILGDLHNLFGDTHAVHVDVDPGNGQPIIRDIVAGDTVREVLGYVQYDERDLVRRVQTMVEQAVGENRIDNQQAGRFLRFYEQGLSSYTYLTGSSAEND